jgi:hypothetical protein
MAKETIIKGKTVALLETAITFVLLILAFCGIEAVKDGWERIGGVYATIFLTSLGLFWTKQAVTTVAGVMQKTKEIIAKTQNGG